MNKKQLFQLALHHHIADPDLSSEYELMSDYGKCTDDVISFTNAIIDMCAEIAVKHESDSPNTASAIKLEILKLKIGI